MLVQWCVVELPDDEVPDEPLPDDELPEDELPEDELPEDELPDAESCAELVDAGLEELEVLAVAAEIPTPRLRAAALAAIPAASKGCFSFIVLSS
jgi:hypothetical protein